MKKSNKAKEAKLNHSLHAQETVQLENFIKTRSQEVDNEILRLREKLNSHSFYGEMTASHLGQSDLIGNNKISGLQGY